ncbi:uncharacterized protein LOC132278189 [Cornus florida]|uniref:uncharacterized protein LOC132278189 n=1 Tax=Cornus florida TaxID=4283 RepID=UPI0028A1437F|nr:uncharacterized protein LOC132278189 [Cornus florida]
MNAIFHDMIGKFMEVYIDDVVVKSATKAKHLADLRRSFERMRAHGLKMNPLKCAFGVTAGNSLGFLVHWRGIEVDKNKARTIIEAQPLRNKKELQKLIGQITYLERFISNRAGRIHTFSPLLKLKSEEHFRWEKHHQHVFESIKEYLVNPPILMPPRKKQPLKLYISAADESIRIIVREKLLAEVFAIEVEEDIEENDWRTPIVDFLKNPDPKVDKKLKIKFLKFVMIDGDLFRKSIKDDLLLRCASKKEAMKVMGEAHEGICGAHQAGIKMKWLIGRYAYYWLEMLKDCITYAKGCQACQRHGPIHRAPAIELQPIIKPGPFRGWVMDLIRKVYPPSSKQHCFIIVVTDYFTKWVEAVPMKSVHQEDVIRFIKQHIIHRFGIPESNHD